MPKITFMGAGSTVFAKSILGDSLCTPALQDSHIALYDIDATRLKESAQMLGVINQNVNRGRAKITAHLGPARRRAALQGANYVVNAIQVGGYKPSTVIDFEIPKKYGLRQTIADTLGIGGIFRSLRTIPVVLYFARDMEQVCPNAWFLNYVNPMAMITGALLEGSGIRAVGLCHSVQGCAEWLLRELQLHDGVKKLQWKIAGINHQAWLLEISDGGKDLYPAIKQRAAEGLALLRKKGPKTLIEQARKRNPEKWREEFPVSMAWDMVRLQMLLHFGYYITESSEHTSEYVPWFIKRTHPELIDEFNIPLDEYPRRCINQIEDWKKRSHELVKNPTLTHQRGGEFGSYIMEAIETGAPARIHGNVLNSGPLISNLPRRACVEVPCLVDRNGVQGCCVGELPEACAAVNRTNINVQLLTVTAALTRKKEHIYQAAMLDPHTAAELTLDEIKSLCDDLITAHGKYLPEYR
ncbi:MAG: alpha-glucosidase/alpha-galactosidase [Planctomycetota bacterium]